MTVIHERPAIDARRLISDDLGALLAADVRKRHPHVAADLADRGVGQMVAFLVAGTRTDLPLSPSELVDEFWHAFILRTEAYEEFCERVTGRFVHHRPEYLDRHVHGGAKVVRQRTIEAISASGFMLDLELWPELDAAKCSQCHAGCHDSPKAG